MFDHETPKPPLRHIKCEKDCDDFLRISLDLILETWDDSFNPKGDFFVCCPPTKHYWHAAR